MNHFIPLSAQSKHLGVCGTLLGLLQKVSNYTPPLAQLVGLNMRAAVVEMRMTSGQK